MYLFRMKKHVFLEEKLPEIIEIFSHTKKEIYNFIFLGIKT
jgi:hypothetical protein